MRPRESPCPSLQHDPYPPDIPLDEPDADDPDDEDDDEDEDDQEDDENGDEETWWVAHGS